MPDPVPAAGGFKLSWPSAGVIAAFSRNALNYAAGAATMAVGFHFINTDQATTITGALTGIANGVSSIYGGVATLVGIGTAFYAAWTATHKSQALSLTSKGDIVITKPEIAAATPNDPAIVSKDTFKAVPIIPGMKPLN